MIDLLKQVVDARTRERPSFQRLRDRYGIEWQAASPGEALEFGTALCRIAADSLCDTGDSVAAQGANALIRFVAAVPADLHARIGSVPHFQTTPCRAWEEPRLNSYIGLCCVVQDVWAHLLGPESHDDDAIVSEITRLEPRFVHDFGAGAGHFTHALAARGIHVDAEEVDPVKRQFMRYRAWSAKLGSRVALRRQRDSYDAVLAINVLDHLEHPSRIIEELAAHVRPGGAFVVLAAFPEDGWHQSSRDEIDRCAAELSARFVPDAEQRADVPWLETLIRDEPAEPRIRASAAYPRLHPKASLHANGNGDLILATPTFHSRAFTLSTDAAEVCERFDGTRSIDAIASNLDLDAGELLDFCVELHRGGHLCWRLPVASGSNAPAHVRILQC